MPPAATQPIRRSNFGFTAVEMLISMALFSFVAYATYNFFNEFTKSAKIATDSISADIDALILQRSIRYSLIRSEISLNLVQLSSDEGLNFYDYIVDSPCKTVCDREFTLDGESSLRSAFVFLELPAGELGYRVYAPQAAYESGDDNSQTSAGSLVFAGANGSTNSPNYLEARMGRGNVDNRKHQYWSNLTRRNDVLLLFHSLVELRAPVNGIVDMSIPPRRSNFVAHLNTNDFSVEAINPTGPGSPNGVFNMTHPLDESIKMDDAAGSATYDANGFDLFLKTIPPIGGVNALAAVREVKLSRYLFKKADKQEDNQVFLQKWDPSTEKWEEPGHMVGEGLHSVVFQRPSISETLIRVKIWDKPPREDEEGEEEY